MQQGVYRNELNSFVSNEGFVYVHIVSSRFRQHFETVFMFSVRSIHNRERFAVLISEFT